MKDRWERRSGDIWDLEGESGVSSGGETLYVCNV